MNAFSFQLPSLSDLTQSAPDVQMRRIRGYLYQLTEQLKFVLNNLDTENFVTATADKISAAADEAQVNAQMQQMLQKDERHFKDALSSIIAAADSVTAAYSAEMNVLSDRIQSDVAANYALKNDLETARYDLSSSISQNASDVTAAFSRVMQLEDAVGSFREETFSSYIRFDADGIELGRSDSDFRCRLTNEKLSFLQGANEIAYVSNHRLHISDAIVYGTLSLGNAASGYYDFQREANGSLSLVFRS